MIYGFRIKFSFQYIYFCEAQPCFLMKRTSRLITALSEVWMDIRAELLALSDQYFISWPEKSIYDGNWTVFPLYKFGV